MKKTKIKIPLFRVPVTIVYGSLSELNRYIDKQNRKKGEDWADVPAMQPTNDAIVIEWEGDITALFNRKNTKPAIIVHESLHLALAALRWHGVRRLGSHNEEILAYMIDRIFTRISKNIDKWDKQRRNAKAKKHLERKARRKRE